MPGKRLTRAHGAASHRGNGQQGRGSAPLCLRPFRPFPLWLAEETERSEVDETSHRKGIPKGGIPAVAGSPACFT